MIITKADLIERTRISANLSDRQVLPFIQDAHTYDLPTLLTPSLITATEEAERTYAAWDSETDYTTGQYAESYGFIWEALTDNTNSLPATDNTDWAVDLNATLRYLYLEDFLCWAAYRRLLLQHGRNITEAGITKPTDPMATFQPATDKDRSEMVADATDKKDFHRARTERFMKENEMIPSTYCGTPSRKGNGRITAL